MVTNLNVLNVKDVKDAYSSSVYLIQKQEKDDDDDWVHHVPDPQKRQRTEIGLDIVDDEEVDTEVDQIEADEEVARLYEDAKKRHRKIMTGGFKWNKYCTIHVEDVEDTVYGI